MACANLTREEKRKEYNYDFSKAQDTHQDLVHGLTGYGIPFFDHKIDISDIKSHLHDTWDRLIYAAKVIPSTSAEHDRLVTLISTVRELGTFTRARKNENGLEEVEEAKLPTSQRLWTDLPYLAQDIQAFWINEFANLGSEEKESLATFTAKLCASGICSAELAQCALWLFKTTLETESSSDTQANMSSLLPALLQWMKHSNHKLISLCVGKSSPSRSAALDSSVTSPGLLAKEAQVSSEGLSVERWLFWRRRLGELYLTGDPTVAKPARQCFDVMALTGLDVGLNIPGEKKYLEKLFKALDEELVTKRGGKGCVYPEDIEIDPAWATEG